MSYRSFSSQKSDLMYTGNTPKNFKVERFILGLPLVHKDKGGCDAQGLPTAAVDYHHFKRVRRF